MAKISWLVDSFGRVLVWDGDHTDVLELGTAPKINEMLFMITDQAKQAAFFELYGHKPDENCEPGNVFYFLCDEWGVEEKKPDSQFTLELLGFKAHMKKTFNNLMDDLEKDGYQEKYKLSITLYGQTVTIPLCADTYSRLEHFIDEEIKESRE